jgi:DNA-directed RNA polymerase subunit omega
MVQRRNNTLMDPPIEDLLDKVDSKFTLVALSSKRARQINSYYNQLGEGLGAVVPPQVTSVSGKPLTIAFEEISASKATYHRIDPDELAEGEGVEGLVAVEGALGVVEGDVVDDGAAIEEIAAVDAFATDAPVADAAPAAAELPADE